MPHEEKRADEVLHRQVLGRNTATHAASSFAACTETHYYYRNRRRYLLPLLTPSHQNPTRRPGKCLGSRGIRLTTFHIPI